MPFCSVPGMPFFTRLIIFWVLIKRPLLSSFQLERLLLLPPPLRHHFSPALSFRSPDLASELGNPPHDSHSHSPLPRHLPACLITSCLPSADKGERGCREERDRRREKEDAIQIRGNFRSSESLCLSISS